MTKNEAIQRCLRAEAKAASLGGCLNKLALKWQLKESELADVKRELNRCDCGVCNWCNGQTYYQMKGKLHETEAELEAVSAELTGYKNKYATMAFEVDCRTLDMARWKERAANADLALHVANTDKAKAAKELGELREHLAIEVGPEMWHLDEVDKAILTERTRCAEIAKKNTDLGNVQQDGQAYIAYGNGFVNLQESDNYAFADSYEGVIIAFVQKEIAAAIMEDPK